jgi:soluble lytic murein transglycosylase
VATLRRYWPWLLFALAGVACSRLFAVEQGTSAFLAEDIPSGLSGVALSAVAPRAPGSTQAAASEGPARAAEQASLSAPVTHVNRSLTPTQPTLHFAGAAAGKPAAALSHPALKLAVAEPASAEERLAVASTELALAARSTAPGRTWQDAAKTADWAGVAELIDGLPTAARAEPGARYARAVAARELGQWTVALDALAGLESALPLLHDEIKTARAHCQMEVGPYEEAYQYFTREQSPENLILAARTCLNAADLPRAQQTVERAVEKIRKQGESKRGRRNEIAARALRARILEARGMPKPAARDWAWLAIEAPTEGVSASADDDYERLSGQKLNTTQRLERMRTFSLEGMLDQTLRERERLAGAPGVAPARLDIASALAWAYYHSRKDYLKASELFKEAAELSSDNRVKYQFFAARALSRANFDDRAIDEYKELARRYPTSGYTEQAHYRIASLEYGLGRWDRAELAYSQYLDRYAKNGGGKYAGSSRYELAISRLGAKQRTDEAASTLGQLARKERRPERRAMLSHLEAVALETTEEPNKMLEAIQRYRAVIEEQPLSFAALASAARLRDLGRTEVHRSRLQAQSFGAGMQHALSAQMPEKAKFLAAIGLHTDAERALFDERAEVQRRYSERNGQALCEMYGALDRGYRSYSLADGLLKSDDLGSPPSASNLWAWRCAYPEPYRDIVEAVEQRYRLPESLVHAVMRQESGFRPNVVSPVGAVGLMQLMPYTAQRAAEEITQQPGAPWVPDPNRPTNVLNNVELGGFYLAKLLTLLNGQVPVAVAAYNAGPSAVSRWLEGGKDLPIDVWVARIPYTETRDYVSHVLGNWLAYRYLANPNELPEITLAMLPGTRAAADAY